MARQENTEEKRHVSPLWPMAVSFLVLIYVVYVLLFMSKGWFSRKNDITGQGTGLSVEDVADLFVYNTATDAGVRPEDEIETIRDREWATNLYSTKSDIIKDDLTLNFELNPEEKREFAPGAHGSFTAYVTTNRDTLHVVLRPVPEYVSGTDVPKQDTALRYAKTHIAFFTDYTNGKYSGWIPPTAGADIGMRYADGATPNEITIYWIWIKEYIDIIGDDSVEESPIGAVDRQQIQQQVQNPTTAPDWLSYTGDLPDREDLLSNAYDTADTYMAIILDRIGFQMDISAS